MYYNRVVYLSLEGYVVRYIVIGMGVANLIIGIILVNPGNIGVGFLCLAVGCFYLRKR